MSPPQIIDAPDGPRFVLKGRLVTMNEAFDVLPRARLCVDRGAIVDVVPAGAPLPDGFADAPVVDTRGTVYPGLIELHNHLSYNVVPPWNVPRAFGNRGQWPRHPDYRRLITGPASVVGRTRGLIEALVRYVEAKCLVAGVTTSQGITLASNAGIVRFYRGIVRNVEQTADPDLPHARTRVPDVAARDARKFLAQLGKASTLLLHLSEGIDDKAREHFQALEFEPDRWAITEALAGIHCAGLRDEDFDVLHRHGGSMVWSPLSNLLLYGGTADVRRARDAGVRITLGSDWSPSGSKNLLAELKVARLWSEAQGGVFGARELVEMVTSNPARALKWNDHLGSLSPGRRADLAVIGGVGGDPYDHLIDAHEGDISLVVINGWLRYGTAELMAGFPASETRRVAGELRQFNFDQAQSDPLVRALTLGEAETRLTDGMARLPELAAVLENPVAAASVLGAIEPGQEGVWVIDFDHEDHGGLAARPKLPFGAGHDPTGVFSPANAAEPLSQILEPMRLDGLTLVDDQAWFDGLAAQMNLASEIKVGLARAYGATLPAPPPALPVAGLAAGEGPPRVVRTLRDLLELPGGLTLDDRRAIVRQALTLLDGAYVHLSLKRAMHAADPVQRLRLLGDRLSQATPDSVDDEWTFHREMIEIFASVRDLHTSYLLPEPFRGYTAYLPFLVEAWVDDAGQPRYLVSKVASELMHPTFVPGVEVLYWNGSPIRLVVQANAAREAGSNADARMARGLASLTVRPLIRSLPPDEEWVTLTYKDLDGTRRELRRRWLVRDVRAALPSLDESDPDGLARAVALGVDLQTDLVNETRKTLYASPPAAGRRDRTRRTGAARRERRRSAETELDTRMPWVFRARVVEAGRHQYGYVRIFTFNVPSADGFVEEFCRLVDRLPVKGLVLDVRGNGGGLIYAAEQLLQVLAPGRVEPEPAELATTPLMLALCRRHAPSPLVPGLDLSPWIPSMEQALRTGAAYSAGFPITPRAAVNAIGQRYSGAVVLITDGLCYSATDMFAAGFQDHRIGPVLGVAGRTGAGGANVWTSQLVGLLLRRQARDEIADLPHGAAFTVAVRRTVRVGTRSGTPVEDLGIEPDAVHAMTRRDLLDGNADLIARACRMLARRPAFGLDVVAEPAGSPRRRQRTVRGRTPEPRRIRLRLRSAGVDRLDVLVEGRPMLSIDVDDGRRTRTIAVPRGSKTIEVEAYRRGTLVAARRARVG
jgi:cytosine/adenosine deaminase-related metal-dependent hydrolase/C-terminal processing protease CtpA/Prc